MVDGDKKPLLTPAPLRFFRSGLSDFTDFLMIFRCALSNACLKNTTICGEGICEPNYQTDSKENHTSGIFCNCTGTSFTGEFCQSPVRVLCEVQNSFKHFPRVGEIETVFDFFGD